MKNAALITWASSGLGKEFAYIHAERWWDLVLIARREDKLTEIKEDLLEKYRVSVVILSYDLTEVWVAEKIYKKLQDENIQLEYLINNAGFWGVGRFHERAWKDESSMIQLNITVLTELCHLFLPDMIQRDSGKILNVSSTASLLPGPNQAVYYATKAFVTSFSNALSGELHESKVTVTALLPWATETEFGKVSGMDKTDLFQHTASARSVALDWYEAMIAWKMNIISGLTFTQKILMKLLPFLPKKMILKIVREGQEIK